MHKKEITQEIAEQAKELGIEAVTTEEAVDKQLAVQAEEKLTPEEIALLNKLHNEDNQDRQRYQYYSFLRKRNKPNKNSESPIVFDPIEKDEDLMDYFARCHKNFGARPAPIGPMKKIPVNSQCICKSGKKYKHCCGRGA